MTIHYHTLSYLTIHYHWPHMIMHDHVWPYMTIHDQTWPYMTIHDHKWPHMTIQDDTYPHISTESHIELSVSPSLHPSVKFQFFELLTQLKIYQLWMSTGDFWILICKNYQEFDIYPKMSKKISKIVRKQYLQLFPCLNLINLINRID